MHKGRLEAFSDGVIAIIITIMVLEIKVVHGSDWSNLQALWPVFLSYVMSFIYVGIYWNNHHHMLQIASTVNGKVLWANLHLLFWLSLLPFSSGWMGENHFESNTVLLYAINLFMCAVAYWILVRCLVDLHGKGSALDQAMGRDTKGVVSLVAYALSVVCTLLISRWLGLALLIGVALLWLVPDRRVERTHAQLHDQNKK